MPASIACPEATNTGKLDIPSIADSEGDDLIKYHWMHHPSWINVRIICLLCTKLGSHHKHCILWKNQVPKIKETRLKVHDDLFILCHIEDILLRFVFKFCNQGMPERTWMFVIQAALLSLVFWQLPSQKQDIITWCLIHTQHCDRIGTNDSLISPEKWWR